MLCPLGCPAHGGEAVLIAVSSPCWVQVRSLPAAVTRGGARSFGSIMVGSVPRALSSYRDPCAAPSEERDLVFVFEEQTSVFRAGLGSRQNQADGARFSVRLPQRSPVWTHVTRHLSKTPERTSSEPDVDLGLVPSVFVPAPGILGISEGLVSLACQCDGLGGVRWLQDGAVPRMTRDG